MEYGGKAYSGAEMLRLGGDGDHGLGARLEQDVVDHRLVLIGDIGDCPRQGEDDVEIGHGQQLGQACGEPVLGGFALALGAVTVAAGVIGDVVVPAVLTGREVTAKRRRAAALDRRHGLQLVEAQVAGLGPTVAGPVVAEDVLNLDRGARHDGRRLT